MKKNLKALGVIVIFIATILIAFDFYFKEVWLPSRINPGGFTYPFIKIDEITLRPGEAVEVPIEIEIREDVPESTELYVIGASGKPPEGLKFTIIDKVKFKGPKEYIFYRHYHKYKLRMRVEASPDVVPGVYKLYVYKFGGIRLRSNGEFNVNVVP